ncbi:MAG TPA: leucine--tRNA ligase [Firmicutes bacterium]|nr:leucine--tRNA ligase [Bacillota bacterium]
MMGYGTGAIMAVPAHDERDFDFARKFQLPIKIVIAPDGWNGQENLNEAYIGVEEGRLVNSDLFNGTPALKAKAVVTAWLTEHGLGKKTVNYRLRDWLISRQRYWGAPIPIIYCERCGTVPVPEKDLPVLLPEDAEFLPTGESPLKYHESFRKTTCPKCGGPAERETDTMDTFMCSSWYPYGYLSPYYKGNVPFNPEEAKYWLPIDLYTGGIEHACMHLIYIRFFTKVMRDLGLVDFDEPVVKLRNQGIILGEDSEKMSKSRGNVVAPDDLVQKYGADAVRAYLMFGWRWEQGGPWDGKGVEGIYRFLNRIWELTLEKVPQANSAEAEKILRRKTHQTIAKATKEIENFSFNTYLASLMELSNVMAKYKVEIYATASWEESVKTLLLLMAPACPHITEEIWARLGLPYSIHNQSWPKSDPNLAAEETVEIVLQINGKIREKLVVPIGSSPEELQNMAMQNEVIQKAIAGKIVKKVIAVPDRLVNVVII